MPSRCFRAGRACEVALPPVERALSLLACGTASAGVACFGAAKTAGAMYSTNKHILCFIGRLLGAVPLGGGIESYYLAKSED